jgi:1-acyl-sn-glycerol-3-phosphate acyltransferase
VKEKQILSVNPLDYVISLSFSFLKDSSLVWFVALCCVIKYHGTPPKRKKNQIYVANHATLLDFVILAQYRIFATVGQKHTGFVAFLQNHLISPLKVLFFFFLTF